MNQHLVVVLDLDFYLSRWAVSSCVALSVELHSSAGLAKHVGGEVGVE